MTVGIAIIGAGRIAHSHIDGIRHLPDSTCTTEAIVDLQESRARSFSEEYGVPYYTSTEEALEDPDVDAVIVGIPHHLHPSVTIEACEAGKHVLVEKVMATSHEDGKRMVEAAAENDVNLMVGQVQRFAPEFRRARERIDEIGEPLNLLYVFVDHFDTEVAPDWWRSEEKTGGLVYSMLGAHSIDYTLWMLGDRAPVSVYAKGASNNPAFEGDDDATVIIGFDDGTLATNYLSINSRTPSHRGMIIGDAGAISWEQSSTVEAELVNVTDHSAFVNGDAVTTDEPLPHKFAVQAREFVDSITEGRSPSPSGEEVLSQLRIIEAARRSAAEGRPVDLDEFD